MDYKDYEGGLTGNYFWFRAKERLIGVLLDKTKGDCRRTSKVLDVGAGTGSDLEAIRKSGDVYVLDVDPRSLALIPDSMVAEKKLGNVCSIPYPDCFFDKVVAFDVLEHVEDDTLAFEEVRRVLKDGGFFVFTVPAFSSLYSSHDKALNHYRRYDKRTLKEKISAFSPLEIGYWMCLLFPVVAVVRLLARGKTNPKIDAPHLPTLVNDILYHTLMFENQLIAKGLKLPIGLTIYGICQKRTG
ncbi:MAG: class I SAM-dependent methyltransferase [Candidatus Altiarchaeota archaeon]